MNGLMVVWDNRAEMLEGFRNTVMLVSIAAIASLFFAMLLTPALNARTRAVRVLAMIYVDVMRCVPFLLFAYFLYFGLPVLGLRLDNWSSGLLALILYNIAYMSELLSAAWRSLPRDSIEAGQAFGFHGFGLFTRIILPPVMFAAVPMIGNQTIQIVKDSAFLTIIAVMEMTHAATSIQTTYFVPFASFVTAMFLYWTLCMVIESGVAVVGGLARVRR